MMKERRRKTAMQGGLAKQKQASECIFWEKQEQNKYSSTPSKQLIFLLNTCHFHYFIIVTAPITM